PAGNILTSPQISLILGSDSRGKGTSARADSILLVRTDPSHHLISMLSIPRDLRVPIPGHGDDKINAAYAFGGPSLLIRTVDALTGFRVNHIVLVDFAGFEDLVNSLGGITINNPTRVVSSQPFEGVKWRFPKGRLHLGGRWALAYARIRKTTNPSDTDISRTIRQQRVMQGIVHKLATPSSLLNLPAVGREIAKPLTTDLSALQVLGLAWIKFRANRTLQCHLGGAFASIGGQDVVVSSDQNRSVVQMFLGESAPLPSPKGDPFAPGCTIG
ncbi:MAG: LCP family protein, partial [Gaiellales bacterium]